MRLKKVTEVPLRSTPEGIKKRPYNAVTRVLQAFAEGDDETAEVIYSTGEYISGRSLANVLCGVVARNRMPIKVLQRGNRVFLTHIPE